MMRRRMRRLLDRLSPWRRGYDEGFDGGISIAVAYVDRLLSGYSGPTIARTDVHDVAARLRKELS
ncbi:hypothetical protein PWY87_19570 [Kribbella solani]|uniref:hypothetical protein n=1 Tax=Kribbella solani TaxID=236067 RepID=UPI0029A3614D|nr:hypothetical protein [Kribbella solani]MDX3003898.1 hypothetical protein [Kribbella solani]